MVATSGDSVVGDNMTVWFGDRWTGAAVAAFAVETGTKCLCLVDSVVFVMRTCVTWLLLSGGSACVDAVVNDAMTN